MAPRSTRVPAERQSTRIRAQAPSATSRPKLQPDSRVVAQAVDTSANKQDHQDVEDEEEWEGGESEADEDEDVVFKSKAKLPQSSVQRWKLQDLMGMLNDGWIDLNPEYQRDVVWLPKSMSGLIDSLIEDYYIPPIIFNLKVTQDEDGTAKHRRICVDGKQRLSSVQAFMRGEIPCHDRRGKSWYYCQMLSDDGISMKRHKKTLIWSEHIREQFRNKSFVSYEFKDLSPIQEEDLFARVQKGVPLTAAEKLHATSGPWQELAKRFVAKYPMVINLSANTRSTGFRLLLASFSQILEHQNPSNTNGKPQTKIQMPSVQSLCKKTPCGSVSRAYLTTVFDRFQEIIEQSPTSFQNNNYKLARLFAPIELPAVAVLISEYMDTRNNYMLIGDIEAMRDTIRQHLPDLRMDNTTWKTIAQFIDELESFRGAADGSMVHTMNNGFTPQAATATDQFRMNKNRIPQPPNISTMAEAQHSIPPARLPPNSYLPSRHSRTSRQATTSTQPSARSTSVNPFTPGSAVSSHTSRDQPPSRSSSVDSVLGETVNATKVTKQVTRNAAIPSRSTTVMPASTSYVAGSQAAVAPMVAPPRSRMNARLNLGGAALPVPSPVIKTEDSTHFTVPKRGLQSDQGNTNTQAKARQTKRARLNALPTDD